MVIYSLRVAIGKFPWNERLVVKFYYPIVTIEHNRAIKHSQMQSNTIKRNRILIESNNWGNIPLRIRLDLTIEFQETIF